MRIRHCYLYFVYLWDERQFERNSGNTYVCCKSGISGKVTTTLYNYLLLYMCLFIDKIASHIIFITPKMANSMKILTIKYILCALKKPQKYLRSLIMYEYSILSTVTMRPIIIIIIIVGEIFIWICVQNQFLLLISCYLTSREWRWRESNTKFALDYQVIFHTARIRISYAS